MPLFSGVSSAQFLFDFLRGKDPGEHLSSPLLIPHAGVDDSEIADRRSVLRIFCQRRAQVRFALAVPALKQIGVPEVGDQVCVVRITLECRKIVLLGIAETLLPVGDDRQTVVSGRVVRLGGQYLFVHRPRR